MKIYKTHVDGCIGGMPIDPVELYFTDKKSAAYALEDEMDKYYCDLVENDTWDCSEDRINVSGRGVTWFNLNGHDTLNQINGNVEEIEVSDGLKYYEVAFVYEFVETVKVFAPSKEEAKARANKKRTMVGETPVGVHAHEIEDC